MRRTRRRPGGASRAWSSPLLAWLCGAGTILGSGACHPNDPVYFPGPMALESDGTNTEVTATLPLRLRASTAAEEMQRQKLSGARGHEVPRLREDRWHVEVKYTVTNHGDREGIFSLLVDGATEFTRFDYPAVAAAFEAADEDAPAVGLIQPPNLPILAPDEVYQGIIREDDFHEASLDLDAMGRWMSPFVAVLINRSEVSAVGLDMVPSNLIRPGLWEITPRFSANQPMTCQFLVRVRDDNQRLWEDGGSEFVPAPTTFTPVVMP
ncbi:MAG: hypothetical protein ABUL77_00440 [Bacteroidota bacterium]